MNHTIPYVIDNHGPLKYTKRKFYGKIMDK